MQVAQLIDAIPIVQDATDRAAKFATPALDQRVFNKGSGAIERWNGATWGTDFVGTGVTTGLTLAPPPNSTAITIDHVSLTGANAQPGINLLETWNTSGAPTAIVVAITDTSSAAGSLFLDCQIAGVGSKFSVRKDGVITTPLLVTSDPGGNGTARFGSGISVGANFELMQAAIVRWRLGVSGVGGLQIKPVTANDTRVFFTTGADTTLLTVNCTSGQVLHTPATGAGSVGLGLLSTGGEYLVQISGGGTNQGFMRFVDAGQYLSFSVATYSNDNLKISSGGQVTVGGVGASAGQFNATTNIYVGSTFSSNIGLYVNRTLPSVANISYAIATEALCDSNATAGHVGILSHDGTPAVAVNLTRFSGIEIWDSVLGAGSSITTQYGLRVLAQTHGATNYGVDITQDGSVAGNAIRITQNATANTDAVVIQSGTVTSGGPSLLNLNQTWNTAGNPVAILVQVTNTASGASSLLLRLRVGATDEFVVNKTGDVTMNGILTMVTAASKIVPGATSFSIRNNANNADNFIVTDSGIATFRATTSWAAGIAVSIGTIDNFNFGIKVNGSLRWSFDTSGNLVADLTNGGWVKARAGTSTNAAYGHTQVLTVFSGPPLTTTSTVEVSFTTFNVRANTLHAAGTSLRITATGQVTGGAGTGTFRLKWGASYLDANVANTNGTAFCVVFYVNRSANAVNQTGDSMEVYSGGATVKSTRTAPTETTTNDVIIDFRGLVSSGATTLSLDSFLVEYVRDPAV